MKTKPKVDTARQAAAKALSEEILIAMNRLSEEVLHSSLDGTIIRTRKFAHIDTRFEIYIEIRSRLG